MEGNPGWRRRVVTGPYNPKPRELVAIVVAKFQKKRKVVSSMLKK